MAADPTYTVVYSQEQQAPYLYKSKQWVGYDIVESIRAKVTITNAIYFFKMFRLFDVIKDTIYKKKWL